MNSEFLKILFDGGLPEGTQEYADPRFERYRSRGISCPGIETELVEDRFCEQDSCFYKGVFRFRQDQPLRMVFPGYSFCSQEEGYLLWNEYPRVVLWFPAPAMVRIYRENGNLESEIPVQWKVESCPQGVEVRLDGKAGQCLEWVAIGFHGPHEMILREIQDLHFIEERRLVLYHFFDSRTVYNLMIYFVGDAIFHYSPVHPKTLRCPCEQCANALYEYADWMARQTGKRWYAVLRDETAYTTLLSLPADGRWRHGHWMQDRETHFRHQLDGIDLLLSEYTAFGQPAFWETARRAMDYVLSCADHLDDGNPWFLHDTLELDETLCRSHYEHYFPSTAFGKSPANTLCLNTHIWTLVLLSRFLTIEENERYRTALDGGMASLRRILEADPARERYAFFGQLRDRLRKLEMSIRSSWIRMPASKYDGRMKRRILPSLKQKHPRLLMPNGYLERDLAATCLNDFYHLETLKDLLLLYAARPEEWLCEVIRKVFHYSHRSGLARWLAGRNFFANIFTETILLYASLIDDQVLSLLGDYLRLFEDLSIPLSLDSMAHSAIADRSFTVRAEPEQVFWFVPLCKDRFLAIFVNSDSRAHDVRFQWNDGVKSSRLRFVFPDGSVKLVEDKVFLSPREYVKIVHS